MCRALRSRRAIVLLPLCTVACAGQQQELRNSGWDVIAPDRERGLPYKTFAGERTNAIRFLLNRCKSEPWSCPPSYDVYQFGVYTGRSMHALTRQLEHAHLPVRKMWGFDSFEGLPEEKNVSTHTLHYKVIRKREWMPGSYNAADILGQHSLPKLEEKILRYINATHPVEMIPGFFNQSLTSGLANARGMRPALFVDIDCDLYSSTVTVLSWLFESGLVRNGTVLAYDDIVVGGLYMSGEGLAHKQAMQRYDVQVKTIKPYCCFEILSYRGMPRDDTRA